MTLPVEVKNPVFDCIKEMASVAQLSKHEQLVEGIINAIGDNSLVQGDILPSVNAMVKEFGFSSKTIVKAYRDLIERGLIESKNRLGYFVINEDIKQEHRIALLLYAFHPIQESFYNAFREKVGVNVQIDVYFHHHNFDIFETILGKIKGNYSFYVVAPIPDERTSAILSGFPSAKLLIVDRHIEIDGDFSFVTQEFKQSTFSALEQLLPAIKLHDEIILFHRDYSDHPSEIKEAFKKFLESYDLKGRVMEKYKKGSIKKNTVYFTIGDGDLWNILKDTKEHQLEVGIDIGIISNSNDPVKEIVMGGITTNSIDFSAMGAEAGSFIKERKNVNLTIPTKLIRRKSL